MSNVVPFVLKTDSTGYLPCYMDRPIFISDTAIISARGGSFNVNGFSVTSADISSQLDTEPIQNSLCCNLPCQANFSISDSAGYIHFKDSSILAKSWIWDFGDANYDTAQNPIHLYVDSGNYEVCLIASNDCMSDGKCLNLYADCSIPLAVFNDTAMDFKVSFSDSSVNASGYSWDFGDGSKSNKQNPTHTYQDTGDYIVCLTAFNNCYSNTHCKIVNVACCTVWPGDVNNDGIVRIPDIFDIGFHYGEIGKPRSNTDIYWVAHKADQWGTQMLNGVNTAFSDCDGDGRVYYSDFGAVTQNYSLTHNKSTEPNTMNSSGPAVYLSFDTNAYLIGDTAYVDVMLGDSALLLTDIYNLNFDLISPCCQIDSSTLFFNYVDSWFGSLTDTSKVGVEVFDNINQIYHTGMVKTNQVGSNGYGKIAEIKFVLSNIAKTGQGEELLVFDIENISAFESNGDSIPISYAVSDTIKVVPNRIDEIVKMEYSVAVFPNPNSGMFAVEIEMQTRAELEIQLTNITGQIIYSESVNTSFYKKDINLSDYAKGIYTLKVVGVGGVVSKKVVYR
ncbi:MAG: hypothetical protein COC01_07270 [Bacteroidetes bacterium]|nr:MAG: hypothetical protein COC01_07270 [Bacteroidota bacterium]